MRAPLITSAVLHAGAVALALQLPEAPRLRERPPIEVEVRALSRPPEPAPRPPDPEPRPPEPKPEPKPERKAAPERPPERRPEEPPPAPTPPRPELEPATPVAPPRRLDLTLHALPGSGSGAVILPPAQPGPPGAGPPGPDAGRKPWRPRGDAGDPILGKVKEQPEERFHLDKVGPDEYVYKGQGGFTARILPDGTVRFNDKTISKFNGTSGSWDLNDLIMRGKRQDPYRTEKERFLGDTAKLRAEISRRARVAELRVSLGQLSVRLEEIWRDGARAAAERRRLIFALWREADAEEGELGDGATEARATIEAFVRKRLPEGSGDAYSEDELAQLNRGLRRRFAPYR